MAEGGQHDDGNRSANVSSKPVDIVFNLFFGFKITGVHLGGTTSDCATTTLELGEAELGYALTKAVDASLDVGETSNGIRTFPDRAEVRVVALALKAAVPFRRDTAIPALCVGRSAAH
jgi:hypothetical protein